MTSEPVIRPLERSGGALPTGLTVERADILSAEARALIEALNAELSSRYPEDGATHFRLDAEEVAPGRGGRGNGLAHINLSFA